MLLEVMMTIEGLQADNKGCTRCVLREGCQQVVPGIGPINARLMIVGEGPGEDEDIEGEPFVGRSGQLLRKLLNDANIEPASCYITNSVRCRPPNNRKPSSEEINACKIWLWREIQMIKPIVILTLGGTSSALLLKQNNCKMKNVIGKRHQVDYINSVIMPWYHPSYLLRVNKPMAGREGKKLIEQTVDWFKLIKESI
jgi:uracil-DNA glycosylase family 4